MEFLMPQLTRNEDGEIRRVGFEIEYTGLDLDKTAELIIELFGGRVLMESPYEIKVVDTRFGEFGIELDSSLVKDKRYEPYLQKIGLDPASNPFGRKLESFIGDLAAHFAPTEVVTPPIPLNQISELEDLRRLMQEHHAAGTKSHIYAAYGLQFNPEVPSKDVRLLLAYLRSFFVLFDWLFERSDVDITRRVLPFIDRFPDEYVDLVLDPGYDPRQERFMIDYLEFNPTRNRPLDLLPLLASIDSKLVHSFDVEHHLIKPRPTFHYRLPNSLIGNPDWRLAQEWNNWIEVENLAADPQRLLPLLYEYNDFRSGLYLNRQERWCDRTEEWLHAGD